jgi:hypothetical protein
MTSIRRHYAGQVLIVLGIIASGCLAGAELIEPSRNLDAGSNELGRIWVFSEPPGLSVRIDGKEVGVTPIVSREIEAGGHTVRVADNSTEVQVPPGEGVRLSFFRGQILVLTDMEPAASRSAQPKPGPSPAPPRTDSQPPQRGPANQPAFWPLNPRGQIY